MLVTDDPSWRTATGCLRGQGMDPVRRYWHPVIGFNYRMTNVQAAIGLAQMERIDQLVGDRKRVAAWYRERLAGIAGLRLPGGPRAWKMSSGCTPSWCATTACATR